MERYETLKALKMNTYPNNFAARFGQASAQVTELIEHLLRPQGVINADRLRRMLRLIYSR